MLKAIREQLAAFREGAGPDIDILVDLNFNYKTEGFLKVARAMEPFDLFWVEIDIAESQSPGVHPIADVYSRRGRRDAVRSARVPAVL